MTHTVDVTGVEDCGNAPKKLWLKAFNEAFATGDAAYILDQVTDDVIWRIIGETNVIQGKAAFAEELKSMTEYKVSGLHFDQIITHGSTGSANGTILMQSGRQYGFCDVYLFTSAGKKARLKEITSYLIPLPSSSS
ncbi:nuclear transport factor 2 family protein [Halobacillus kuroshimensis]|uniref:Nuclear transport factor 2 family protein n=1 Tax=Halobacillus kuroshimensis TaxID=302481 RepID=A0ABS3DWU7_9BACI|nr:MULTISPECIES: nuclear transport factor 2 family protein [Halobacillus]MBN8235835.1 nuclear transport factor 2 family protein [Halobacillus kuroshimensis]